MEYDISITFWVCPESRSGFMPRTVTGANTAIARRSRSRSGASDEGPPPWPRKLTGVLAKRPVVDTVPARRGRDLLDLRFYRDRERRVRNKKKKESHPLGWLSLFQGRKNTTPSRFVSVSPALGQPDPGRPFAVPDRTEHRAPAPSVPVSPPKLAGAGVRSPFDPRFDCPFDLWPESRLGTHSDPGSRGGLDRRNSLCLRHERAHPRTDGFRPRPESRGS